MYGEALIFKGKIIRIQGWRAIVQFEPVAGGESWVLDLEREKLGAAVSVGDCVTLTIETGETNV